MTYRPHPAAQAAATQPCAQHPHAPVIGDMCGGCTIVPSTRPVPQLADVEEQQRAAQEQPASAGPGDLFTESAIYASALHAAAIEAENTARMFCDEAESRTTVETLQGLAERFRRLARGQAMNEQPTAPTWEDRAAHAVGMYATTAVELEDARATIAALHAERTELIRQRDRIAHDTVAALAAPTVAAAHPDQQAGRRAILDSLGTLAHAAIWPHPGTDDMPENTDAVTIEVSHTGMDRRAAAYALHQVADRLAQLADANGDAPLDEDATAAADARNEHLDAGVPADATERPEDTARRLAAVEQLCSGRPGYHTITVKALLTAMSDADHDQAEEQPAPLTAAEVEQGQADADHLAAEHPDTIESLLTELADDLAHLRRARPIAADYLARYTRLLVAEARERQSERNAEMRAEGYRGRVAWCSGMREAAALLDVRADAIAEAGR